MLISPIPQKTVSLLEDDKGERGELSERERKLRKCRDVKSFSFVRLFAIPWTVVYQASLSMGFSRQEYWSGLPFLSPGDLPDPGIEPRSPAFQADALPSEPPGKPLRLSPKFPGSRKCPHPCFISSQLSHGWRNQ